MALAGPHAAVGRPGSGAGRTEPCDRRMGATRRPVPRNGSRTFRASRAPSGVPAHLAGARRAPCVVLAHGARYAGTTEGTRTTRHLRFSNGRPTSFTDRVPRAESGPDTRNNGPRWQD